MLSSSSWRSYRSGGPRLDDAQIEALKARFDHPLPSEYLELLTVTDGLVFDDGLAIYGADELQEMNEIIHIAESLPGYLTIGNDSGGREVVTAYDGGKVFWLDQGYVAPDGLFPMCDSLSEWFDRGLPLIKVNARP